jgi:hypothetical protein
MKSVRLSTRPQHTTVNMMKLGVFALALFCAFSLSTAGDCGSSSFQLSKFNNVYIFNWLCKGAGSDVLKGLCGIKTPAVSPPKAKKVAPKKGEYNSYEFMMFSLMDFKVF